MRVWTLVGEEIRALPRTTFGMGALGVVLLLIIPVIVFGGDGASGIGETLLPLVLVLQLAVAIIIAARVAGARSSRFVDSLYTTPLDQRTWLAAQAIVGLFLALLTLLPLAPFLLLHVALVGAPAVLPGMLVAVVAMAAFAVALGLFCGVVAGEAGTGAGAGLAGGLSFLALLLFLMRGMALGAPPGPGKAALMHASGLSPLALALEVARVPFFGTLPEDAWRPALALVLLVAGLGAAAWLAYVRAQGPLGWERRGARAGVVALVALALAAPLATAGGAQVAWEDGDEWSYAPGEHTKIGIVPPGGAITDDPFTVQGFVSANDLTMGEDLRMEILVMLLAPDAASLRDVRIVVAGGERVQVVEGGDRVVSAGTPDGHARPTETFEEAPAPNAPLRPVYRVPVVLRPVEVAALLDTDAPITIDTAFVADGRPYESHARMTLETDVPNAATYVAIASAPCPLAAFAALARRKITTR